MRWVIAPTLAYANDTPPGVVRAASSMSLIDRHEVDGCTAISAGIEATRDTGAKSRSASYGSFSPSAVLSAIGAAQKHTV